MLTVISKLNNRNSIALFSRSIVMATATILVTIAGHAADATWTNDAASTWITSINWSPNAAPGATSGTTSPDTATFSPVITANRTVTVDANRNVSNIIFNANTKIYTLASGPLVLSAGGMLQTIGGATVNDAISAPMVLGGNYTLANNGTGLGVITPSGSISGSPGVGTITLTLDTANTTATAANLITGVIGNGVGNTLSVLKKGSATQMWQLNGVNTFTGGLTIQEGVLGLGNAAAGGPALITLGNGSTVTSAILGVGSVTATNSLTVSSGPGTRALNFTGGSSGTFSGPVTLNNDLTMGNITAGLRTASGGITGTGNVTLNVTGAGPLILSGGSINNNGGITNAGSGFGNVTNTAVIGSNVARAVQNSDSSFWFLSATNT